MATDGQTAVIDEVVADKPYLHLADQTNASWNPLLGRLRQIQRLRPPGPGKGRM